MKTTLALNSIAVYSSEAELNASLVYIQRSQASLKQLPEFSTLDISFKIGSFRSNEPSCNECSYNVYFHMPRLYNLILITFICRSTPFLPFEAVATNKAIKQSKVIKTAQNVKCLPYKMCYCFFITAHMNSASKTATQADSKLKLFTHLLDLRRKPPKQILMMKPQTWKTIFHFEFV